MLVDIPELVRHAAAQANTVAMFDQKSKLATATAGAAPPYHSHYSTPLPNLAVFASGTVQLQRNGEAKI